MPLQPPPMLALFLALAKNPDCRQPSGGLSLLCVDYLSLSSSAFYPKFSNQSIAGTLCTARIELQKLLLQSCVWKSPWQFFPLLRVRCHTLMGYLRPEMGGRKLSPKFLTELNGPEPILNHLLKSWHGQEERIYGKGQTEEARAVSLGKWESC